MGQPELQPINEDDLLQGRLPCHPFLWYLLIQPLRPPKKNQLIELPDSVQHVEEIHITIARVLAVGPLAFQNNTEGGLDMRRFSHDISEPQDLIGAYVMYKRFTGANVYVKSKRREGERLRLLLIDDDAIMCDVDDPAEFVFYLS